MQETGVNSGLTPASLLSTLPGFLAGGSVGAMRLNFAIYLVKGYKNEKNDL